VPRHCAVAAVAAVAVARERNCWKRLSVVPLCTSDQNADWLSTNGRTAKIGFNPICYGTAVTAQRQAGTATAQRNGGNQQRNSYGAYGILTEFVCDEQRFTKFRYRNYKYYLAKPVYLLFLGRDWFFDAIG